jgi:hypothetical protein
LSSYFLGNTAGTQAYLLIYCPANAVLAFSEKSSIMLLHGNKFLEEERHGELECQIIE